VTGNAIIGNGDDGAGPNGPFAGDFGPNRYSLSADITTAEDLVIMNYERPT
jgi:hypothetical protein